MRTFLNAILSFIGSESLTDEEFAALPEGLTEAYNKANYDALKAVLQDRESVSGQLSKLYSYFQAKGVDVSASGAAVTPNSQILVGVALD